MWRQTLAEGTSIYIKGSRMLVVLLVRFINPGSWARVIRVRVITKSSYDTSSRFLLNSLGWVNLSVRRAEQKANLMHECINNRAPAYLCNLFAPKTPNYDFGNPKKKLSQIQELIT